MRPRLARELVRNDSAYGTARVIVDVLLTLALVGCLILGLLAYRSYVAVAGTAPVVAGLAAALLVYGAGSVVVREVVHAVFDIADALLAKHETEMEREGRGRENPFH